MKGSFCIWPAGLSFTFLTWEGNCVLMYCASGGLCEEWPVHTATCLLMEPSLWLPGPLNKLCPEAVFKLPSVSLNIRSCSLFISDVLPYYSCWISTWTGQCGTDLALLTGWLFPLCFGQNSSLFGTKN